MKTDNLPEGVPKYVDFSDNGKVTRFELHPLGKPEPLAVFASDLGRKQPENRVFLRHGDLIETPMRVVSFVLDDNAEVSGVWAEPIEGSPRAEDVKLLPKPYTERDIIELACRPLSLPAAPKTKKELT